MGEGSHLNRLLIKNSCLLPFLPLNPRPPHTQMVCVCVHSLHWKDTVNKGTKAYHLDNKSPQVSRIFSAHSLETSPDPLSNGSSLSAHKSERDPLLLVSFLHVLISPLNTPNYIPHITHWCY